QAPLFVLLVLLGALRAARAGAGAGSAPGGGRLRGATIAEEATLPDRADDLRLDEVLPARVARPEPGQHVVRAHAEMNVRQAVDRGDVLLLPQVVHQRAR